MSMRGGYQIIDLRNKPLYSGNDGEHGENHITIPRIYYNLFNSNARMILLSGLSLDGKGYRDYEIIPYENEIDGKDGFQAILRKNWNTNKKIVTTYYLNIANDDDVFVTFSELKYEDVDQELNAESEKAIANGVVTKEFLKYLPLAGGAMTGNINMNSNKIENVYTPKNPTDAANKKYVDFRTQSLVIVSNAQSTESSPNHGGYAIVNRYGNTLDIYFHIDTLSNNVPNLVFVFASDVLTGLHATNRNVFTYVKVEPPGGTDVEVHYSELTINTNSLSINLNAGGGSGLSSGFAYSGHVMLVAE